MVTTANVALHSNTTLKIYTPETAISSALAPQTHRQMTLHTIRLHFESPHEHALSLNTTAKSLSTTPGIPHSVQVSISTDPPPNIHYHRTLRRTEMQSNAPKSTPNNKARLCFTLTRPGNQQQIPHRSCSGGERKGSVSSLH